MNSPVLQFGAPPAIDSGEAKICNASWENVNKHMHATKYKITLEHVSNSLKMWIKRFQTEIHNKNTFIIDLFTLRRFETMFQENRNWL